MNAAKRRPTIGGMNAKPGNAVRRAAAVAIAEGQACQAAKQRQKDRFRQEQRDDLPASRADRFQQADLTGALADGDEHDVHDQDTGDDQADRTQSRREPGVSVSKMPSKVASTASCVMTVTSSTP